MHEILLRDKQALVDQVEAHEREKTAMHNRIQNEKENNSKLVDKIEAIKKIGDAYVDPDATILVDIPKGITSEEANCSK